MGVSLPAVLTIATGVGLLVLGVDVSFPRRVRSAGRFDLIVGAFLAGLGTGIVLRPLPSSKNLLLLPFTFLVVGIFLYRNYLLKPTQHRDRDLYNSALSAIPGLVGMIGAVVGSVAIAVVTYLMVFLVFLVGLASLLYDVIRLARGKQVYKRDLVVAATLTLNGYLYVWIPFASFYPPP
ncbi:MULTISPECIES: hypothetical protein [Haloarcula]|uniref:hypothetical protein n=1 Tax=Haloarcula TaxID=2237 RepID=UPI0023E897BA|nr:hypothetical protein [Halomicroarcula sp. SHR3]